MDLAGLTALLAHYGMTSGAAWGDGDVDLVDLAEVLSGYGTGT